MDTGQIILAIAPIENLCDLGNAVSSNAWLLPPLLWRGEAPYRCNLTQYSAPTGSMNSSLAKAPLLLALGLNDGHLG